MRAVAGAPVAGDFPPAPLASTRLGYHAVLVSSGNVSNGVLTLSGTDTAANYQQVLRTIAYDNAATSPDGSSRVLSIVASDGVNQVSKITTVNVALSGEATVTSNEPAFSGLTDAGYELKSD